MVARKHGYICPWGGSKLAACVNRAGWIVNRLKALPGAEVAQDGDDGANVLFDVAHFDEVAEIMKPRRRHPRRRLTPEQKARAVKNLTHFKQGQNRVIPGG